MPFINIKIAEGRSLKQKQKLVNAITKQASEILDVKPEWITIIIDEYSGENWATEGKFHVNNIDEDSDFNETE